MRTIKLDRKQANRLFVLESMGVPSSAMEIAKNIVNKLISELSSIEDEIEYYKNRYKEEDDEDGFENYSMQEEWEDYFEYELYVGDERDYCIELFFDSFSRKKADTDGNGTITINFAPIQSIIDKSRGYEQLSNDRITNYLYPIILHELTHDSDSVGGNNDHIWLGKHHRLNEGDLRSILYVFADNELNARISSAAAIMEKALNDLNIFDYGDEKEIEEFENGQQFKEFVDEWILNDKETEEELHISEMESYVKMIGGYFKIDKNYINREKNPYSLSYDLFRNDSRLKNNRKLKRLFQQNYNAGEKYVADFYRNLLDNYKRKIYRSCWYAYQKFLENNKN